jgi:hypothetical protein
MGPNALFSFDHFINMTILNPFVKFWPLPCSSSTGTNNRAAGRRAVVMVFAPDSHREPSGQFYHDVTNPAHLSGLSHLDNFIVTLKSCPLTGTLQKLTPTLTQTATKLNRRAVMLKPHCVTRQIRLDRKGLSITVKASCGLFQTQHED